MGNGIFQGNTLSGTGGIGLGLVDIGLGVADPIIDLDSPSIKSHPEFVAVSNAYNAAVRSLMTSKGMTLGQANTAVKNSTTDPTYAVWSLTVFPSFQLTANQQAAVAYATQQGGGTAATGTGTKSGGAASRDVTLPTAAPKSHTALIVGGVVALAAVGGFFAWKKGMFGKRAA